MRSVVIKRGVACGAETCTNYWFCGRSVLEPINLHGLKTSALANVTRTFGACSKLKTILMDLGCSLREAQDI